MQSVYTAFQIQDCQREDKIQAGKRQTVFFTAVNPTNKDHKDPHELALTKPRLASYKQKKWKRHQDTVYWVDIQLAQRKGLKFYQTRCSAIILYDTLQAYCISKVVVMECGEIIHEKLYVSPQPPPTISFKDNWMKELDSEVAGSSKDTNESNQNQKPNYQERRDPWVAKEFERYLDWSRGHQALNKNGETRGWIQIHPKLRVDAFKN